MIKKIPALLGALLLLWILTACGSTGDFKENSGDSLVPVTLSGGSGKATVESPAEVRQENGELLATIKWSSPNYDYMIVNGEKYYPVNTKGNSVFEIPIPSKECTVELQADTTAMSTPHLISYTLIFGSEDLTETPEEETEEPTPISDPVPGREKTGEMELQYATQFTVEYYEGGLSLITIAGTDAYLLVPEEGKTPDNVPAGVTVLRQNLENIYLVSSSAMDMFRSCGAMDSLRFCALQKEKWHIEEASKAMEEGKLLYAGKYSTPDYEILRDGDCSLTIENMMISHSPEVVESLENLGIPVMVEYSSYEPVPQGRMEWVKLYGLLTGHLEEAEQAFQTQVSAFDALKNGEPAARSAALFYVTTAGTVSVRNASDYLPQMITLAGGNCIFDDVGLGSSDATTTIQMEEFYARAKDADFLLYNSTIEGELNSLSDFLALSPLFENMKAVKEGNVYCISQDLYQKSMELGDFTLELYHLFRGDATSLTYLKKLS